ncbi:unnamed protein product, partial [Rotaria sp. Silwood1]
GVALALVLTVNINAKALVALGLINAKLLALGLINAKVLALI